jgi:uncharacterized YccA/Bax inhibitor family protein
MIKSSNPALKENTFTKYAYSAESSEQMTINGVVTKTAIALLLVLLSSGYTWMKFFQSGGQAASVSIFIWVGMIGGLILAIATVIKNEWAPVTTPFYALFEGLFLGSFSAMLEASYPGIVIQAAGLTFGTLASMLVLYQTGIIKATEGFKMGVFAATGGIAIVYFITIILSFFGVHVPAIYGNGWMGIGFSLFVVAIAALNFIIDFDFIEQSVSKGVPKYMEWYGAFALMVTLIWLYIEILRLLAKLNERK